MTERYRRLLPWLALVLLAVVPYAGSLKNPLLHDDRTLLDNPWLQRDAGVVSVFEHDYWHGTRHGGSDLYRPLTILTLAWNSRLARTSFGFRSVNVALHAIVVLLVAAALTVVSRALGRGKSRSEAFASWCGAAVFAVHPLASEAVLWAVGRAELLGAAFGLLAFLLLAGDSDAMTARVVRYAGGLLCFALALLSKESAATWLVVMAVWIAARSWSIGRAPTIEDARRFAGLLAVFVAYLALRGFVVGRSIEPPHWIDNPLVRVDTVTRVANAAILEGAYLLKMAVPWTLSVEYGFDQIPVEPLLPWGAPFALLLAASWVGILLLLARASTAAAYHWVFIPAAFAVTGNFAFTIGTIFADRLAYLPLVGASALIGLGAASIPWRRWGVFAAAILLAGFALRTAARVHDYRSLIALHEATARSSPRAIKALANQGRTLLRLGRAREAVPLLERATEIWPDYARALDLLSDAYGALGDPARSAEYRRRALDAAAHAKGVDEE